MPSRIDLYIDMVNFLLLNMIHFQRKVNWTGFLELTREFIFYILFSLKRQNYARCLSFDYIQMLSLPQTHLKVSYYLHDMRFTTSISRQPESKLHCDQIIEMARKPLCKETFKLLGKRENADSCKHWIKINHIILSLREHIDAIVRRRRRYNEHKAFGIKRMIHDHNNTNGFEVIYLEVCGTPQKNKSTSELMLKAPWKWFKKAMETDTMIEKTKYY